jgi:hypothetical protein
MGKKDILFGQDLLNDADYTCLPGNYKLNSNLKQKDPRFMISNDFSKDILDADRKFCLDGDFLFPHDIITICEPYKELEHPKYHSIVS